MDKRDSSDLFKQRLLALQLASGKTQSAFAKSIGIDRSAISQLLSGNEARLPRVSTLLAIAEQHQISIDWLLGISDEQVISSETRDILDVEVSEEGFDSSVMAQWHSEAIGQKIRYVPTSLPDLLRTDEVIAYEAGTSKLNPRQMKQQTAYQLNYSRQPESDMEVCMSKQTLSAFAKGEGIWSGLDSAVRKNQIMHMSQMVAELYPTFRLYLFDAKSRFSIPYTLFGYSRAAIYAGDLFLIIHAKQTIRTLCEHFDDHIRNSSVEAHRSSGFLKNLL